eukprot:scaffold6130_cov131-Cylindrotheca_fusiformis.AAC.6
MTEAGTKPANWEKLKEEVASWIDGENHCVTAQRISQTLDLSRNQGSKLLQEISQGNPQYQITTCRQTKEANATVFRLRTSTAAKLDDSSVSVFALSPLEGTESVETAHERDMVQWREMVADQRFRQEMVSAIAPANELARQENSTQPTRTAEVLGEVSEESSAPLVRPGKPKAKAKAMTASSFFGTQQLRKKVTDKKSAISKPGPSKPPASKKENQNPTKLNQVPPPSVGNADDFSADEEVSDDEEVLVKRQPARKPARLQKDASPPSPQPDPEPEPRASPVRGAMDAFASSENNNNKRQRKRRKKLVEKTTMVGGYLRTETITVWEDVLTDEETEEEEKKKSITKTKLSHNNRPKNPQNMKQMGLMGKPSKSPQQFLETVFELLPLPDLERKVVVGQLMRILGQIVKLHKVLVIFETAIYRVFLPYRSYTIVGVVEAIWHPPNPVIRWRTF